LFVFIEEDLMEAEEEDAAVDAVVEEEVLMEAEEVDVVVEEEVEEVVDAEDVMEEGKFWPCSICNI
jgi:hypothetical protein